MDNKEKENLIKEIENYKKITEITKIINSTLDIGKLLRTVMESIKEIMQTEASSLLFFDEKTDELVFKAAVGEAEDSLNEQFRISTERGIAGWTAREKKAAIVNNVYNDPRFNPEVDYMTGFKTQAVIAAPLLFKGKLIGVIEGINPIGKDKFENADLDLFILFADQAVMAVQNAIVFEKSVFNTRVSREIERARDFQKHLFKPVIYNEEDILIAAENTIAGDLGGEFFQIIDMSNSKAILTGDIHSHGIDSALKSAMITGAVKGLTYSYASKPLKLMHCLRDFISSNVDHFHEISLFYGIYNKENRSLEFINTGFAYPVIIRDSKAHYLKFNTHSLNSDKINEEKLPSKIRINLQKDDIFLVATDGIVNLKNSQNHVFGLKNVMNIAENSPSNPEVIISTLKKEAAAFLGDIKLREDITIICFQIL